MKRSICGVLAMLLTLSAVPTASAATTGPILDFKGVIDPPPNPDDYIIINTRFWKIKDRIVIRTPWDHGPVPLTGVAYVTPLPDPSGNARLTTLYGIDLNPSGPDLSMTGFGPNSGVLLSDEVFITEDGTEYPADFAQAVPLGALHDLFHGFDLSHFSGDPNSIVFAFGATVPGAAVPEPASLALLGASLLLTLRRRT